MCLAEDKEWGDCNKCGMTRTVHPEIGWCEYCGCQDPEAEYPDEEWLKGENPYRVPPQPDAQGSEES